MRIAAGRDDFLRRWVYQQIGIPPSDDEKYATIGVLLPDGTGNFRPAVACVFFNFHGHDIEVAIAAAHPRWASRRVLNILFGYPFRQLGCVRMTAVIARKNRKARVLAERLGFKLEGVIRKGMNGKMDAMLYGCLAEEAARWLLPPPVVAATGGQ